MINEDISQILNRDLLVSTKRGVFSSPSEICQHVNNLLDASFSSRAISVELQEIGWQRCGSSRAKRKIDNRASAYIGSKIDSRKHCLIQVLRQALNQIAIQVKVKVKMKP